MFCGVIGMRTLWFDNEHSGGLFVGRCPLKRVGGPSEQLNVAPKDGWIAEAMRAGHIPFTRSRYKRPHEVAFCIWTSVTHHLV